MSGTKNIRNALSLALLGAFSVAVFAADPPAAEKNTAQEKSTARIRLFGQNAVFVKYYPNSKCEGGDGVTMSGGFGDAFSSFVGSVKNQSIGMPDTPNTINLGARDGILSKAYFREYEIAAGQPLTIAMGFREAQAAPAVVRSGTSVSPGAVYCRRIVTTFTPEKGKDYEAALNIHSSEGVCVQTINEVSAPSAAAGASGGVALTPVAVERAQECE